MNSILFGILWVLAILLSTVFMSLYIRKSEKNDAESLITAVYVIYLALSQILAAKMAVFWLWVAPAAVLIYPFTYQLTDTMNEHYGKEATLKMIGIAFITQVLMVLFIAFGNAIEPADFWWISNDQWLLIFGQQFGIIGASWISFLITGYLDTIIYVKVRKWTKNKYLWIRSVLSDIPMLALDSVIFVTLAFGVFGGNWDIVLPTIWGQMVTKWFFGIIDTPFLYLDRWIVNSPQLSKLFKDISSDSEPESVSIQNVSE
ncbi:MAG: queuosine precursor transporter [Promethearchaeota archaeon]